MNKTKYVILGILEAIWHDLTKGYNSMSKPKEILNVLFYVFVIEVLTNRKAFAYITIGLFFIVYIWKIIKQGDWKHKMRDVLKN